jgi:zinc transport system substrate-binding protein
MWKLPKIEPMSKRFIVVIIIVFISLITVFSRSSIPIKKSDNKLKIITTLFPLYDFAKNIGKDKVDVTLLLPPGVEAHTFEPKPSDIVKINEADIFIYTGKYMEPWAEEVIQGVSNKNLLVIDSSVGIPMIPENNHDTNEPVGANDPHIWLDFDNDKIIIQTITKAFIEKDTLNSSYFQKNVQEYQNKLTLLDEEYKNKLSNCKTKEIVYGGHYAFGYLSKRYNLLYVAAQGVSPDSEPTAQDLAILIDQIKKNNIQYIFYEELTSPKITETLANETHSKMLLLNAAHNITKDDLEKNVSFLTIMENNLINLKNGLQCSK